MVEEEIRCSNLLSWVKLSRSNLIERKQRIEMTTKFKGKERSKIAKHEACCDLHEVFHVHVARSKMTTRCPFRHCIVNQNTLQIFKF